MNVRAPSVAALTRAIRAGVIDRSATPRAVADNGTTPALWTDCVAWEWVDDDPAAGDRQDVVVAIHAGLKSGKLRDSDDTAAKIRGRLAAEIAQAKTDRQAGRPVRRVRSQP